MTQGITDGQTEPFRPSKRRKFYRKRTDTPDEEPGVAASPVAAISPEPSTVDELLSQNDYVQAESAKGFQPSVAEILRLRKTAQRRKGGIEFSNFNRSSSTAPQPNQALAEKDDGVPPDIKSVIERFAPQTGQVSEATDKHMMAYIEVELAKRQQQAQPTLSSLSDQSQELASSGALTSTAPNRQPASLGKLHEIDLGPSATLLNIARTEAAQRKLEGHEPEPNDQAKKPGKVRLRPNGKPYGPRRKRRNSDDIKRDKLVEEVMRESKFDMFDEPDAGDQGQDEEEAADDRIAEQFRRDFMEAISTRRKRSSAAAKQKGKGKAADERPKGPKLGGSRSARAAMREREEAAAAKKR